VRLRSADRRLPHRRPTIDGRVAGGVGGGRVGDAYAATCGSAVAASGLLASCGCAPTFHVSAIRAAVARAQPIISLNAASQSWRSAMAPIPHPLTMLLKYPTIPVNPTAAAAARLVARFMAIAAISICGTYTMNAIAT